jgi:hypothetical protein
MGKGGNRGQGRPCVLNQMGQKELKALENKHQVQNLSGLIRAFDAMGVPFMLKTKGKGKGKGKDNPDKPQNPGQNKAKGSEARNAKKGKGKGKGKEEAQRNESFSAKAKGGRSNGSASSSQLPSRERVIVVLKSNPDIVATMLDGKDQPRIIQFICHQCFQAHYHQRSTCVACKAERNVPKEPTQYDPDVHVAKIHKAQDLASLQKAPGKESNAAPNQPAAAAPPSQPTQDPAAQEAPPQALDEAMASAEDAAAETIEIGQWHPTCLNKASMKLCIQEECTEVLQYKKHFDITDLAESELRKQVEELRRRISIMSVDPALFGSEWVHAKQKLASLEEQLAKEDQSQQTTGEHHATGGRLQTLLGRHIQAMHLEEQEHVAHVAEVESQILDLKAGLATREKEFAKKLALNEALKTQLQTKVDSFTGPAYRLAQLGAAQATQNMTRLTEQTFSKQWLQETGLSQVASDEVIQSLIAKAMTVAQQAQTMGIRVTPPIAPEGMQDVTQHGASPGLQQQTAATASLPIPGAPPLLNAWGSQHVLQTPAHPVFLQTAFHSHPTGAGDALDEAGQTI